MSTLVLSPTQRHSTLLDNPISSPIITSPSLTKSQSLPPLLSRLPPALLASPRTSPIPIAPLSTISSIASTSSVHSTSWHQDTKQPSEIGYTESSLPDIDQISLALHYELYKFKVLNLEHYATSPYESAFNWNELKLPIEMEREWWVDSILRNSFKVLRRLIGNCFFRVDRYIVAFRSIRKKGADTTLLYQADREAHEEAVKAGGLLLYWWVHLIITRFSSIIAPFPFLFWIRIIANLITSFCWVTGTDLQMKQVKI